MSFLRHGTQHDWKDTISGVHLHVSPGSAETLVRRGGITNHHLTAYSLSNISAKNYHNRLMCVEVIVCNISVVFLWHSLDGTRWAAVDRYASACCDLDLWPFNLMSTCQVQVHTWPNFGENIYKDVVFNQFFVSLTAVTFDLWSQKPISTSTTT